MQKKKMQTVEDIGKGLRILMYKMTLSRTKFSYAIKSKKTKLKSLKFRDRRFKKKSHRLITKYKSDVFILLDESNFNQSLFGRNGIVSGSGEELFKSSNYGINIGDILNNPAGEIKC